MTLQVLVWLIYTCIILYHLAGFAIVWEYNTYMYPNRSTYFSQGYLNPTFNITKALTYLVVKYCERWCLNMYKKSLVSVDVQWFSQKNDNITISSTCYPWLSQKKQWCFNGFSRSFQKHHFRDRDPVFCPGKRGNLKKFFMAWIVRQPKFP